MKEVFIVVAMKSLQGQSKEKQLHTFDNDKSALQFVCQSNDTNCEVIRVFCVSEFGKVTHYTVSANEFKFSLEAAPEQAVTT